MSQSIAIVGASTRAAAASAKRAGFTPITADLFADADLRAIATTTRISPYPEGFLDWLRTVEPPAWMYTGALENHLELIDQMAWIAPLWGNPGDVLQRVRDPFELAVVLRDAGLLFPETRFHDDGLPRDGTWLAKTYQGASGSGVRVLSAEYSVGDMNDASVGDALPPESRPYFQHRIPGISSAAVFAGVGPRAILLGTTRQLIGESWLGAHGFQYAGSIGPLAVDAAVRATIERIGNTLVEQFELAGLFGVDLIINAGEVWTVEVNPRYTASVEIVERMAQVNALTVHANAFQLAPSGDGSPQRAGASAPPTTATLSSADETIPPRPRPICHGKAILFAKRDIVIWSSFAQMSLAEAQLEPWPALADVSPAGTFVEAGRPILTVFADGKTTDVVEQRLRHRVAELELMIYGGDRP